MVFILLESPIGYIASEHTITLSDKQPDQSMMVYLLPRSLNASEIVVSAGKRSQSIQEVPVSISLLDQQQISRFHWERLAPRRLPHNLDLAE